MGTSVYFNNGAASREQFLIEDMVIESIKNHGVDIFYLPRDSQSSIDELFGDDPVKSYTSAYPMEMYLETFNDFEGNQEFFSKFGLEVQKTARFSLARRTFERYLPSSLRNTPKEGDLIWIPFMQKLMEIKFVEQEKNFFQLGRGGRAHGGLDSKLYPYMYGLDVELFKFNGEFLNTGIEDVDNIADFKSYGVKYTMQAGGIGTYNEHEIAYQGASLATATAKAYVSEWNSPNRQLTLRNIKGAFASNTIVYGVTSGARWTLTSGDVMENVNDAIEDNVLVEQEADNIIDFSEINPFGEP